MYGDLLPNDQKTGLVADAKRGCGFMFFFLFFFPPRPRVHEVVEESRHGRPARHRTVGQVGLGGVGRRQDGAGRGPGPAGRVPGGHRRGPAVRHARAPATGRPMLAGHTVLPDDNHRQGQRDDGFQGRGDGRRRKVSVCGTVERAKWSERGGGTDGKRMTRAGNEKII